MNNQKEEIFVLEQLKSDCNNAFEKLYYFYRPKLSRFIFNWVKSEEVCEEILQEVFIQVWQYRFHLDLEKSFKSYIYKIAKNLIIDYFKSLSKNNIKLQEFKNHYFKQSENTIYQSIDYKETNRHLHEVLNKIPVKCREVYVLCKLEGYSYEEVSKLLNISIATVNNHIVKASKIIKSVWFSGVYVFLLFFFIFK